MAEGVDNVHVVHLSVGVPLTQGGGLVISGGVDESQVVGDRGRVMLIALGVAGVSLDGQVGFETWDINLFYVGAGEDE